ncbi:restriction endonuclease subunit S [Rhizobium laguerreae]|uniref:restriction endonuclease subunit S n=1 Tax=Rhizobium laguerreae TaxID=1076926 RepID=UPI001C900366|nr:restriction endonuclease subunit S [Rhizobium laguerreae]MBY3513731.1 restriction endonuclease subunit S [Rhizobium laguerreae]
MVRAGYKQTEVGEIPEDWGVEKIGSFDPFVTSGSRGWAPYYSQYGSPFVRITNMVRGSIRLDLGDLRYVNLPSLSAEGKRTALQNDDILVSITADIGICSLVDSELQSPGYINQHIALVRFNSKNISPRFVAYFLNSRQVQKLFVRSSDQGAKAGMNLGTVRSIEFAVPQYEEQKAIAGALSNVDALIASLEKLIEKKRDIKTAMMQQLLTGKMRLPGFEAKWCHTEIGKHIDLLTGFPFPSSGYTSSGVRLLRGSNIKRGQLDWSDELIKFWPKVDGDIAKYALQEGDIVVAMDGSLVGRSFGQISKSDLPALLLQRVARVRSKGIDQGLLKEWICSPFFTEHCDNVKTVTAVPHISPEDILKFRIRASEDLEEQKAIAAFLSDASNELRILESRLSKTKAIKQGMMQELLTGRTRLV